MPYILIIGTATMVLAIVVALYYAYANITNSSIVLAIAAFVGSGVLLFVNVFLTMKTETQHDLVSAEYTLDRKIPELASAFYSSENPGTIRGINEKVASAVAVTDNPRFASATPEVLAKDMGVFSILSMLFGYQPDWQLRPISFKSRYTFGSESAISLSKPEECKQISKAEVQSLLVISGNIFADGLQGNSQLVPSLMPIGVDKLCLPPLTDLEVTEQHVKLENPFVTITFTVQTPTSAMYRVPMLRNPGELYWANHEEMPNGESRYTNMPTPIDVEVIYSKYYATHKDMEKYHQWVDRLTKAMHEWFEGTGNQFIGINSPLLKAP